MQCELLPVDSHLAQNLILVVVSLLSLIHSSNSVGTAVVYEPQGQSFNCRFLLATCRGDLGQDSESLQ